MDLHETRLDGPHTRDCTKTNKHTMCKLRVTHRFSGDHNLESIKVSQLRLGRVLRYSLGPAAFCPLLLDVGSIIRLDQGGDASARPDVNLDAGNRQALERHDLTRNSVYSRRPINEHPLVINNIDNDSQFARIFSKVNEANTAGLNEPSFRSSSLDIHKYNDQNKFMIQPY